MASDCGVGWFGSTCLGMICSNLAVAYAALAQIKAWINLVVLADAA